jgi:glycosyltransferase involved in cell wall biosynthesis
MKIIHTVLGKANPNRMNGVNKVAYQLAKTQQELGHDVTLWGIANSLEHNYPERNFKTVLFKQLGSKFRLDGALELAIDSLSDDSVVHLHGAFIPAFYWLSKRLQKRGVPYVITPHGSLTEAALQQGKWRKRIYFQLFEKKLLKGAKAVHLLGDMEFGYLDQLADVQHKALIPNGMDLSELPDIDPCQAPEKLTFGFCGRLDAYHKGLDLMLQGFALFRQKGHVAYLELIGDGPDRRRLAQMADQLGIGQQICFHGAKYGYEKYRLMARADLFLHTSRMEGFPMAVLEAAALGLPCLTSEATNINRYIRQYDAGFPMDGPPDPVQICEAMESAAVFYEEKKLELLGKNARAMVREFFDWQRISQELVAVYQA